VENGYWPPLAPPAPGAAPDGVRDKPGVLDDSTKLERLTDKALDKATEVLELPTTSSDEYGHVLRAQTSVITTVLNTQVKVDERRLRRQQLDRLPALFEEVNRIAAGLPPMIDVTPS
jgi:hypothetical protein